MEKVRRKISRHYIDNMSIKNSFVFYALISLVIGIVIGVISITLVDDYRINLNYKYEHKKQMNLFYSAPAFHYFCNTIAGAYPHLVRSPHRQTKHTK